MDQNSNEKVLTDAGLELKLPSNRLRLQQALGAYMRWDGVKDGDTGRLGVVSFETPDLAPPEPPTPNLCRRERLLDLMGFARTAADGSVIVHVRDYVCWPEWKIGSEDQVWVNATPRSSESVTVTHVVQVPPVLHGPAPSPLDVDLQIRLFSWDHRGQAKANVFVTWRAVFPVSIPTSNEE